MDGGVANPRFRVFGDENSTGDIRPGIPFVVGGNGKNLQRVKIFGEHILLKGGAPPTSQGCGFSIALLRLGIKFPSAISRAAARALPPGEAEICHPGNRMMQLPEGYSLSTSFGDGPEDILRIYRLGNPGEPPLFIPGCQPQTEIFPYHKVPSPF